MRPPGPWAEAQQPSASLGRGVGASSPRFWSGRQCLAVLGREPRRPNHTVSAKLLLCFLN